MSGPRILEVRTKILKANDELAREMRRGFERLGLLVDDVLDLTRGDEASEELTIYVSTLQNNQFISRDDVDK